MWTSPKNPPLIDPSAEFSSHSSKKIWRSSNGVDGIFFLRSSWLIQEKFAPTDSKTKSCPCALAAWNRIRMIGGGGGEEEGPTKKWRRKGRRRRRRRRRKVGVGGVSIITLFKLLPIPWGKPSTSTFTRTILYTLSWSRLPAFRNFISMVNANESVQLNVYILAVLDSSDCLWSCSFRGDLSIFSSLFRGTFFFHLAEANIFVLL